MSGYLLDTHVVVWWFNEPERIARPALEMLRTPPVPVWTSAAALWEMAIKKALGRMRYPDNVLELLDRNGIGILPIRPDHALSVASLPLLHGDPFDRIQIAQALSEGLTILTRDDQFESYGVPCLRA